MNDTIFWGVKADGKINVHMLQARTGEVMAEKAIPDNSTRADAERIMRQLSDRSVTATIDHSGDTAPAA